MAQSDILTVSAKSQELLIKYIDSCYSLRDEGWQLRNRLEDADRAYMREGEESEEQRKAQLGNKTGDKTKLQNIQVPMVLESVENTTGFLTNVYLLDYPMFKFVSDPDKQDIALMWNTLVGEDQIYYGWTGEFSQAFRNGAKYNFAPIEVEWCKRVQFKPVNGTGSKGVNLERMVYEGNKIRSIDPYNLIYDPRVPIHKIHEKGEFIGYVEPMTRIELKIFLASLGEERLKNDKAAFEAGDWAVQVYTPQINKSVFTKNNNWNTGAFNWAKWAFGGAHDHIAYKDMYSVATIYARIMPWEFEIRAPQDQTPNIWKLIAVNGIMVYAQPMINGHDMLPIIIAQPKVDNLDHQTKSQAENQIPFQDMTSALWNGRLSDARRRVMDRMLYNPLLIDPDHINSPNPAAKIPLRPSAYGRKLEEAVYQIPYHGENSQMFLQDAQGIAAWGQRIDGKNNTSLGQYQKGNKLQDEFQQTMENAGIPDRTNALMWENYCFVPIKTILKSNYLQMAPGGKKYNRLEQKTINIDIQKLREIAAEFQIGDGLLPAQRLARTDVMQNGMQMMAADPQIAGAYDRGPMFTYMMKVQGVDKLEKFEKAPEVIQYEQSLRAWSAAHETWSKVVGKPKDSTGAVYTPEDIVKTIGPMPQFQPPETQNKGVPSGKP